MKRYALLFLLVAVSARAAVSYTLFNRTGQPIIEQNSATTIASGDSAVITGERSCVVQTSAVSHIRTATVSNATAYPANFVAWGIAYWDHKTDAWLAPGATVVIPIADGVTGYTMWLYDPANPVTAYGGSSSMGGTQDFWVAMGIYGTPNYADTSQGLYSTNAEAKALRVVAFVPDGSSVVVNLDGIEVAEPVSFWLSVFLLGFSLQTAFELSGWSVRLLGTLKRGTTLEGV